jgi:type IV pilus assembly protein PilW
MKKFTAGFSLLELLVASALTTLVISGLLTIYLSVKLNSNRQQVLMELQDAARFLQTFLSWRIRQAGFTGCVNGKEPVNQDQAIVGYDSGHLPPALQNQVVSGTDALIINSCVSESQISQNSKLVAMAYFIGDTHRTNRQGHSILGLFQKPLDGSDREELADGVEQMQIQYGVDVGSGNSLAYYTAPQVSDWSKVRGVEINLLLNSVDEVLKKPQSYYFHGQTTTASDLLLRKSLNLYIALRERIAHD